MDDIIHVNIKKQDLYYTKKINNKIIAIGLIRNIYLININDYKMFNINEIANNIVNMLCNKDSKINDVANEYYKKLEKILNALCIKKIDDYLFRRGIIKEIEG